MYVCMYVCMDVYIADRYRLRHSHYHLALALGPPWSAIAHELLQWLLLRKLKLGKEHKGRRWRIDFNPATSRMYLT